MRLQMMAGHQERRRLHRNGMATRAGLLVFCACFLASIALGQSEQHAVFGLIYDIESDEALTGAAVMDTTSGQGDATDLYGRFLLLVPEGAIHLHISYLGYADTLASMTIRADTLIRVGLRPVDRELTAVEVSAELKKVTSMSDNWLIPREIDQVPAMGGVVDVVKALQLLPGVMAGTEGEAGLYIRGGSDNQTLFLLDGTPVYNMKRLFGLLSVYNSDVVRSVKLVKGAGSSRYGGRLSSVLDVAMKEGNLHKRSTTAKVGLLSASVTTEGPIRPGNVAYLLSFRRAHLGDIYRLFQDRNEDDKYHYAFYDVVGKVSMIGEHHGLYLSIYGGLDRSVQSFTNSFYFFIDVLEEYAGRLSWGNLTGSLRWHAQLSPVMAADLTVSRTAYGVALNETTNITANGGRTDEDVKYRSSVADWSARMHLERQVGEEHRVRLGGVAILHGYLPGRMRSTRRYLTAGTTETNNRGSKPARSGEAALYLEDEIRIDDWGRAVVGVRASGVLVKERGYAALEPRLSIQYRAGGNTMLDASYAQSRQYAHFLSRQGIGVPMDIWLPPTDKVGPQRSWELALGATHFLGEAAIEVSSAAYFRRMKGLVTHFEGYLLIVDADHWERYVHVGDGEAYGLELLARKRRGRLTGWVAYTLARTTRRFDGMNEGKSFPYRADRRHDLAVTARWQLNGRWALSGTWVFSTGNAISLPVARTAYVPDNTGFAWSGSQATYAYLMGPRNGTRSPPYHRLDFGAQYNRGRHTATFGCHNIYAHRNPFLMYARAGHDGRVVYKKVSLFILIPTISYSITL